MILLMIVYTYDRLVNFIFMIVYIYTYDFYTYDSLYFDS